MDGQARAARSHHPYVAPTARPATTRPALAGFILHRTTSPSETILCKMSRATAGSCGGMEGGGGEKVVEWGWRGGVGG